MHIFNFFEKLILISFSKYYTQRYLLTNHVILEKQFKTILVLINFKDK